MAQEETDLEKGIVGRGDWQRRWDEGDTGFQKSTHDPRLDKYEKKMFDVERKRVFVPLSGKCPDVIWFYKKGLTVVGIDIIEQPCRALFEENKLEFTVKNFGVGMLYKTKDEKLQVYVANLFDLTGDMLGLFDIIWERSSLCAINIQDRPQYCDLMVSLLKPGSKMFLVVREYDPAVWPGPPHTFTKESIKELYGARCNVELLEEVESSNKDAYSDPVKVGSAPVWIDDAGKAIQTSSYIYHRCYLITKK